MSLKTLIRAIPCFLFPITSVVADYDDGMRYAFLASKENRSIVVIDIHARDQVDTFELEEIPGPVAASDRVDSLVVAYPESNRLGLLDLNSKRPPEDTYQLDISPDYIKLDPVSDLIAIYDRTQKTLEIHNLQKLERLLRLEDVSTDIDITFDRRGDHVFWIDRESRQLNKSDLMGNVSNLIMGRSGAGFSAMTRSVDGSLGYISDSEANRVYVVNIGTLELLAEVKTGKAPARVCGTADGLTILVPNTGDGTISAFSSFTFEPLYTIDTIDHPVAVYPAWLDATAAVVGETGEVAIVDLEQGSTQKIFKLQGLPGKGIVSHNTRYFLFPIAGYASITIFDMEEQSIIERIVDLPGDIGDMTAAIYSDQCN